MSKQKILNQQLKITKQIANSGAKSLEENFQELSKIPLITAE